VRYPVRHLVSAVLVSLALAAPGAAQGFIYGDIEWGSDPQTTTDLLAAQGFELEEDFVPDEGELMYTSTEVQGVIAVAAFAEDELVGLRFVFSGGNMD
jgi:hypothetical protein